MAQVQAQVVGGEIKMVENVTKVSDVRKHLALDDNYQATINGDPASDTDDLNDYEFVSFAPKVKGA